MTANETPWKLSGPSFSLTCGQLTADGDLRDFSLGLHILSWAGLPVGASILGPQLHQLTDGEFAITDFYIRGADLVVSCERPEPAALVPQFYWRARLHESLAAVGIELILSMRTDLLDSQPQTRIHTSLLSDEVLWANGLDVDAFQAAPAGSFTRADLPAGHFPAYVFRRARERGPTAKEANVSYFQMVHPDDFFSTEICSKKHMKQLATTLFPERLEKGVIRRARVCGWFLPAENDLAVAVELAKQFIDEPLPLTA